MHNYSDTSLDWIRLIGLTGVGQHGVFEFERAEPHDFVVDVHLGVAALTADDHVGASVDYSVIAADAVAILEGDPVNLIETLAHRVAERCLEEEPVVQVSVTVHKPQAPVGVRFTDVAVTLNRSKRHQTSDSGSRE